MADSLYKRLGGYDAIAAVADDLLPRLSGDQPLYYVGRDMKTSHRGMGIDEQDWQVFMGHVNATLEHFKLPAREKSEVLGFVEGLKKQIVE